MLIIKPLYFWTRAPDNPLYYTLKPCFNHYKAKNYDEARFGMDLIPETTLILTEPW